MKKLVVVLMLTLTGSAGVVFSQIPAVVVSDKTGWHKLGETKVNFKTDRDEFLITGADRFSSIKFKVTDESIDLVSVEVAYESGDNQLIKINSHIKAPGDSRQVDLNGGERSIRKVVFIYKTLPNRKDRKAHLELWGLKTNEGTK